MSERALRRDRREIESALREAGIDLRTFARATGGWHVLRFGLTCWSGAAFGVVLILSGQSAFIACGIMAIAIAQHAMLNVAHEACHYTLFPNRALNDLIGDILFALPIGTTIASYRAKHELHHRHLGKSDDPVSPLIAPNATRTAVIKNLAGLLLGKAIFDLLGESSRSLQTGRRTQDDHRLALLLAYHLPILAGLAYLGFWYLWIVWVVISANLVRFIDGVRTVAEHRYGVDHDPNHDHTRVHHTNFLTSAIATPFLQYHWEHHLFPWIPHSRLGEFHRLVISLGNKRAQPLHGGFPEALREGLSRR